MKKYCRNLLLFNGIYSLITFLILPIAFMDWSMKVPHIFDIAIGLWYLIGILLLCILIIAIIGFKKVKKEKRSILVTFILIYIVFEIVMFWFTLIGSRMGIPSSVGATFFSIFILYGIIAPVTFGMWFHYYRLRDHS